MPKVKLQTPRFVLKNGELIPWADAVVHVGCEAVKQGLSVFEGIKGYWLSDGNFGLLELRRHYDRLRRSASLLQIPYAGTFEEFKAGVVSLTRALLVPEKDLWIRTPLFVVEGHWGEDTRADLIMTAYQADKSRPRALKLGISTWQRSADNSVSYRIKSTANYQVSRLARIEGRSRNCDDMILLNQWGRVAEATGAALLVVRDHKIITPAHTEGALESITVDIAQTIAQSIGIEFERRPIDRTELLIADEMCLCGTLNELVPAAYIDDHLLEPGSPVLSKLRSCFYDIVRGAVEHDGISITRLDD